MTNKKAVDDIFIEAAIKTVAEQGIESTRTREIADCTGFSEATMFRRFPSKEVLLQETFLHIDRKISAILTKSTLAKSPCRARFESDVHTVWRKVYRYLIDHRDETVFLIRYRYSSLYTDEVRQQRQALSGGLDQVYRVFEQHYGRLTQAQREFLISCFYEITFCFVNRIITEKIGDDPGTEKDVWTAVSGAIKALTGQWESGEIE